jgi:hypothetical protein
VKRKFLDDVSSIASDDSKKKKPTPGGFATKKCMYHSEERPSIQVIGIKLTPESAGVDVTTNEWLNWVGKPNKEMAKRYGVTFSASTGKAPCWQFFYIIDDHTKLAKLRPDLNLKAMYQRSMQSVISAANLCYAEIRSPNMLSLDL